MKNKINFRQRGITLVALIITIIILLILAGISIAQLTENGLFDKLNLSSEKNKQAVARENLETKIMEYRINIIEKNEEVTLEKLKEYFDIDNDIEEMVLYYQKQASLTDNFQTMENGNALYAKVKLKEYKYRYTLNKKVQIVEIDDVIVDDNREDNNIVTSVNIEKELQEYLDNCSLSIELEDVLTSDSLMKKILNSDEAVNYILEDKECLEIILNNEDSKNLFFADANVMQKVYNKLKKATIENLIPLIPQLSSNNGNNGIASCSSSYGTNWDAWIAFNNRTAGDGWYPIKSPSWIQYEFNTLKIVKKFLISANTGFDSNIPNAKMQYSNDGENWQDVTDFQKYTVNKEIYVELPDSICAKYYRLYLTTGIRLYKFQLYGANDDLILNYVENKSETNKVEKIIIKANIQQIKLEDILFSDTMINKLKDIKLITVPNMRSASQDGFIITSSAYYENGVSWAGWKAFDSDLTSSYTFYPVTSPGWVQVEYPDKVALFKFYYSSINSISTNCKILSSNDGINWTSRTGYDYITIAPNTEKEIKTTEFAKYWRFETITDNQYYNLQFYAIKNN